MTPATASTLQRDVDAVVSAADASRWDASIAALDQLEADAASAQATGRLCDELAALRAVRQRGARRSAADPPLEPGSGSDHDHANHRVNRD